MQECIVRKDLLIAYLTIRRYIVETSLGRKHMRTTLIKKDVNAIRDLDDIEILWDKYPKASLASVIKLCSRDSIEKMINILNSNCFDKNVEVIVRTFAVDYNPKKAYFAIDRLIKNNDLYGNVVKKLRSIQSFIGGYRDTSEDLIKTCAYSDRFHSKDGGKTCIRISPAAIREVEQELVDRGVKVICARTILEYMFKNRLEPYLSEQERKKYGMK